MHDICSITYILYIYIYVYYKYIYIYTYTLYIHIYIHIYIVYTYVLYVQKKGVVFFNGFLPPQGDITTFKRRRETEIKHGRVAMYATMGCSTGSGSLGWPSQDRNGINILMG